jgi:hypothetical protein
MKNIKDAENVSTQKASAHDFSPKQADWGRLNPLLLGKISLCDKKGKAIEGSPVVTGLPIDAEMSLESQYNSPFENSNPENRLPVLMGMLQSGDWVNTVDSVLGSVGIGTDGSGLSDSTTEKLNQLEGRSNFTKMNSTQIYVSSAPVRFNVTMFFQAWKDAKHEVEHQIATLQQWAMPVKLLGGDSLVSNFAKDPSLQALFPSEVPPFVSFRFAKKRYSPLLIENVSAPLITPFDQEGNRLAIEVTLTLCSRTAWDKTDIKAFYG